MAEFPGKAGADVEHARRMRTDALEWIPVQTSWGARGGDGPWPAVDGSQLTLNLGVEPCEAVSDESPAPAGDHARLFWNLHDELVEARQDIASLRRELLLLRVKFEKERQARHDPPRSEGAAPPPLAVPPPILPGLSSAAADTASGGERLRTAPLRRAAPPSEERAAWRAARRQAARRRRRLRRHRRLTRVCGVLFGVGAVMAAAGVLPEYLFLRPCGVLLSVAGGSGLLLLWLKPLAAAVLQRLVEAPLDATPRIG